MSDVERVREGLTAFVTRNFNVSEQDIDMDQSLIDQGIIDSFGLVEITAFIEQSFAVKVREEDMTREAFGSMNRMARFVASRMPGEQ
jgi:acyl carrier protein